MNLISRKLVFLTGKQRSGKDTVADMLVEHFGFHKVSLADKVKEVARDLFKMEGKDRGLLIKIGTGMRAIDEDVWVNYLLQSHGPNKPWVIPDVRFLNEFNKFKEMGGVAVAVDADVEVRSKREGYDPEYENDPTEGALVHLEHDYRIDNNGTIPQLFMQVYQLGESLRGEEK